MRQWLKQALVVVLSIAMCTATIPVEAMAGDASPTVTSESPDSAPADDAAGAAGDGVTYDTADEDADKTADADVDKTADAAQGTSDAPQERPVVRYRLHRVAQEQWADDEGWVTYEPAGSTQTDGDDAASDMSAQSDVDVTAAEGMTSEQGASTDEDVLSEEGASTGEDIAADEKALDTEAVTSPEQSTEELCALDAFEAKVESDAIAVTYRILDQSHTWSTKWLGEGKAATAAEGIYGIEMRLTGDDAERYDVVYRAQTSKGTWLGWARNGSAAGSSIAPIVDVQLALVQRDLDDEREAADDAEPDNESPSEADASEADDATTQAGRSDASSPADADGEPAPFEGELPADPTTPETEGEPHAEDTDTEDTAEDTDAEDRDSSERDAAAPEEQGDDSDRTQSDAEQEKREAGGDTEQKATDKALSTQESTDEDEGEADASDDAGDAATSEGLGDDVGLEAQASTPSIQYQTHVQSIGWQGWVSNGALSGTSGRSLRLEAMRIRLKNASGSVVYSTHAQTYGWLGDVKNGATSGTTGESKRLEAVTIKLTGAIAKTYDVWYRAHVQTYGWQGWVKNGAVAGTSGQSKRVEALEVLLVKKGDAIPTSSGSSYTPTPASPASPGVYYQTHVQTYGWQAEVANGKTAGTSGQSKRLEAIRVAVRGVSGGVTYRTHVQTYGWQSWRSDGTLAGTSGESKRLEAIQFKLTGSVASSYDIWYRVHTQSVGWMGWAKNGASAGSEGYSLRLEAIQVKLVPKGSTAPSNSDAATSAPFLSTPSISYRAYLRSGGWQGTAKDGATAGKTGVSARIQQLRVSYSGKTSGGVSYTVRTNTGSWPAWSYDGATAGSADGNATALCIKLTGDASSLFDVWYRVHISHVGWLDWAKNGASAGSDSSSYPIEALEVRILRKKASAPGSTSNPYYYARRLNGVDISGWDQGIDIAGTEAQFFIIKATEGVSTTGKPATRFNPWYKTWADQALSTGRCLGFYHYANGGDAVKEADEFYNAIKDYKGRAIACLDWEGEGNELFDTGMDVAWCKKFLDRLKSKFGGTPFLYTSKSYTNAYNWSSVAANYPLWGAQYPDYEDMLGYQWNPWQSSEAWGAWGSKPTIFQYTGSGVLQQNGGIQYFDFDLFYGNASDWAGYCR